MVLCARRTLTIVELADAVAISKDEIDKHVNAPHVLKICSNFITADQGRYVLFAHHSVREYLEMRPTKEEAMIKAHTQAAETCLTYLNLPKTDVSQITVFISGFPRYTVMHWASHCQLARENRKRGGP